MKTTVNLIILICIVPLMCTDRHHVKHVNYGSRVHVYATEKHQMLKKFASEKKTYSKRWEHVHSYAKKQTCRGTG